MPLRRHRSKSLAVSFLALAFTMPAFTQAFKDRAASFYEQGEFMKAAQALETHVKENPGDFSALLLIGLCYQQAGDPLGAAAAYQRAVDLRPKGLRGAISTGASTSTLPQSSAKRKKIPASRWNLEARQSTSLTSSGCSWNKGIPMKMLWQRTPKRFRPIRENTLNRT